MDNSLNTSVFESAADLLLRTARRTVNTISSTPNELAKFCHVLTEVRNSKTNKIHIVGTGRAQMVGKFIGEGFKDAGFRNIAYFGDLYSSSPIKKGDCILAVSGSGWTKYTTSVIELGIRKEAEVLTLTSAKRSKAGLLSNAVLTIPMGIHVNDHSEYRFLDWNAPLTPLGTIFELTALLVGIGIVNAVQKGACTRGFDQATTEILKSAESARLHLISSPNFPKFFELSHQTAEGHSIFFLGTQLGKFITAILASRFNQLYGNSRPIEDWRFRSPQDLLLIVGGSGTKDKLHEYIGSALASKVRVIVVTPGEWPRSKNVFPLVIPISESESLSRGPTPPQSKEFLPRFEYSVGILLESCIAQIASSSGLGEDYKAF